jgi:hypothetical protein
VVRKGEQVSNKKLFEARPRGLELALGLFEPFLRHGHLGKTPVDLRLTAGKHRQEQRLRVAELVLAGVDLRQVYPRLHIAWQIRQCASIPERGATGRRYRRELSPEHAELKADPRRRKGRHGDVAVKGLAVDGVRFGIVLEIGKQGAERYQIFKPAARRGDTATDSEHCLEVDATSLVDRQPMALDCIGRSAHQRSSPEVVSGLGEAMRRGSDLGLNQRCTVGVVYSREVGGERIQAVECVQIAEKLGRQALVIDHRLGSSREARVSGEPGPGAAPRALQVDRGDLTIRRGRTGLVELQDRGHWRSAAGCRALSTAPKRSFRLPRPVFSNVETAARTRPSG